MPTIKKDYTMYNKVLENPKLSMKAKGVMLYMLNKPVNWKGHLYDIVQHCKDGRRSISSAVKELKEAGYIKTVSVKKDGLYVDRYYKIINEK